MRLRLMVLVLLALAVPALPAGKSYMLAVGGMPGSPVFARRYRDWLTRLHGHMTGAAGVPAANVVVLSGDKSFKASFLQGKATTAGVLAALEKLAAKTTADDQFILFLVGHGTNIEGEYRLQLPGRDLMATQLAAALKKIKAKNQVVLNFSGSGGGFLAELIAPGRVNITANAEGENSEPVFAEFFLQGLETKKADGEGGKRDGRISVLEAYNYAVYNLAQWVCRQKVVVGGDGSRSWAVSGKESVRLFKKLYGGGKDEIGARVLSAASRAEAPDPKVIIRVPTGPETKEPGFNKEYWTGRRTVVEHALLEDCGEDEGGVYGLIPATDRKNYLPLNGRVPDGPGHLAGRTVLGRAAVLPPPPKKAAEQ